MFSEAVLRLIYWVAASIALGSLAGLAYEAQQAGSGNYYHLAPLIGSLLVALGWIVTTQTMIKTNMRQHTITVMLHYDSANVSQQHRKVIIEYLPEPNSVVVPGDKIPSYDTENHPFYEALDYELNQFDFMGNGVFSGVLDEELLRGSLDSKFLYYYTCAKPYIDYTQGIYGKRVWGSFCALCERWKSHPLAAESDEVPGNPYSIFVNAACDCGQRPPDP
jgi:hypothetical protein